MGFTEDTVVRSHECTHMDIDETECSARKPSSVGAAFGDKSTTSQAATISSTLV